MRPFYVSIKHSVLAGSPGNLVTLTPEAIR